MAPGEVAGISNKNADSYALSDINFSGGDR